MRLTAAARRRSPRAALEALESRVLLSGSYVNDDLAGGWTYAATGHGFLMRRPAGLTDTCAAGLPATVTPGSTSCTTIAPAPRVDPDPMLTLSTMQQCGPI